MNETSIDLVDLIRRILLRWKAILLWMVIFAVLLDGFYYVRAVRANVQTVQEEADSTGAYAARVAELEAELSAHEIAEVETALTVYGELMTNYREGQYAELDDLRAAWENLYAMFSTEQKEYYDAVLDAAFEDGTIGETEADAPEVISGEDDMAAGADTAGGSTVRRLISRRYVALGLLIGLLFVIVAIAIAYVFGRKLRIKEDITEVYDIPLLGFLDGPSIKLLSGPVCRGINRAFTHGEAKFTAEERMQMMVAGIRLAAEKAKMKNLYLTGAANGEAEAKVREELAARLTAAGFTVGTGKSVVYDPESLETMTGADGVILVEHVDASTYEDMAKEAELCRRYEVPVIGGIVIR